MAVDQLKILSATLSKVAFEQPNSQANCTAHVTTDASIRYQIWNIKFNQNKWNVIKF